ncbi:tRNA (cytosine(34)-C(5))-methyltransferase [Chionoecetes opilio]|uniref:tRNA (Cytosine(34)-C(5))-methyltransferase n=1 Tax=Chionoecetes opilio TaxID=41210 RepID=A0A8J4Y953_CHIOP|nr:tRNA (cytosine(34)-C(5))-methyltransferase [Chionoecetes opilio]
MRGKHGKDSRVEVSVLWHMKGEWDEFLGCMKENLPAAFRLTGTKNMACALLKVMKETFFEPLSQIAPPELTAEEKEAGEEPVKPLKPFCLPWYPNNVAWQLNLTRKNIRRCEAYWQLHQFLISETETGNISRQEAVSMIPPVVLDVKPHHKVLDMCAAPGSKTAQLIEFLHGSDDDLSAAIPEGIVVANDADNKRCYMLTHQAKRLQSPAIIITNHDAAFMPNIHHTRKGDGTLRKNFDVWAKWNPVNGANLHGIRILPHHQDTGGFFVAVLEKTKPLPGEKVYKAADQGENPTSGDTATQKIRQIINTGVKVLVRSDNKGSPCDFRLAQDGARVLLPLITKRKICVTKNDLVTMLQNDDMEMPPEIVSLDPKTQEQCADHCTGASAFLYEDDGMKIDLVGWKGNKSVRAYVAKNDRIHYLRLLGADTSKYEKNKFAEQRNVDAVNVKEKESSPGCTLTDSKEENGESNVQDETEACDDMEV